MNKAQVILLIVQVVILIIQCTSELRERKRIRASKKGVFEIGYCNFVGDEFSKDNSKKWIYDFEEMIPFKNIGDDAVTLLRKEIIVDGIREISLCDGVIFSNSGEFSILQIPVRNLNQKDEVNISFLLSLRNSYGYKYTQVIKTKFKRDEKVWKLVQYGWEFKPYKRLPRYCNTSKKVV